MRPLMCITTYLFVANSARPGSLYRRVLNKFQFLNCNYLRRRNFLTVLFWFFLMQNPITMCSICHGVKCSRLGVMLRIFTHRCEIFGSPLSFFCFLDISPNLSFFSPFLNSIFEFGFVHFLPLLFLILFQTGLFHKSHALCRKVLLNITNFHHIHILNTSTFL